MAVSSRKKILDAARIVFTERGKDGARVDNIAKLAGVNKAMIYYYFSSKDQLYYQVLKNTFLQFLTQVKSALDLQNSPTERLTNMVNTYHKILQTNRDLPKMIPREIADGAPVLKQVVAELITSDSKGVQFRFKDTLDQAQRENNFRDVHHWHTLVSLLGMTIFPFIAAPILETIMGSEMNAAFWRERPQAILDLFLHGITTREAT